LLAAGPRKFKSGELSRIMRYYPRTACQNVKSTLNVELAMNKLVRERFVRQEWFIRVVEYTGVSRSS
jgi:hypothetical protein